MKPLLVLCCALVTGHALAQEQEAGLMERVDATRPDSTKVSNMQSREFNTAAFNAGTFSTDSYRGVKDASVKTFETRSFFGIKNPWFGPKVFDTTTSSFARKTARESEEHFETAAYGVREYSKSRKDDAHDAGAVLPSAAAPRPYLVPGKTQGAMDRFTENLQQDLSIDDVRALLNKGTDR